MSIFEFCDKSDLKNSVAETKKKTSPYAKISAHFLGQFLYKGISLFNGLF